MYVLHNDNVERIFEFLGESTQFGVINSFGQGKCDQNLLHDGL